MPPKNEILEYLFCVCVCVFLVEEECELLSCSSNFNTPGTTSSVAQSCLTLCDPMDCSMPGLPVHHQLPELAQTHVHRVGDAIQPSHPLSSLSLPFNLSQHQSFPMSQFFASGGQRTGASIWASVLPMNIQDWFPSGLTGLISLQSKGLSRDFSNTTVQKHQFFGAQLPLWFNSHICMWCEKNHSFD